MRPPPEGALYHAHGNPRFDAILDHVLSRGGQVVLLPRTAEQAARYRRPGVVVPEHPVDGRTLLATVDLTIGAGGTMTRESALLGTPTYTVFLGELAAQDAELIRLGRIVDLRGEGALPAVERRPKHDGTAARRPRRGDPRRRAPHGRWRGGISGLKLTEGDGCLVGHPARRSALGELTRPSRYPGHGGSG